MHNLDRIRTSGDYLERHYADNILSRIPGYAHFWMMYIGNDGQSAYLKMPGATREVLEARARLWEHLYTIFENLALCWRLEEVFSKLNVIGHPTDYANNLNDWIAFYAHLGRIHDMGEKVADEFATENLFESFDPFYRQRHIVLHYPKVPMRFVDDVLTVPKFGEAPKNWQKGMRWEELKGEDFHFVSDIVSDTLRDLEKVTNSFFFKLIDLVKSEKSFSLVKWPIVGEPFTKKDSVLFASRIESEPEIQAPPSGTMYIPPKKRWAADDSNHPKASSRSSAKVSNGIRWR